METMSTSIPPLEMNMNKSQYVFQLLSLLLQYPEAESVNISELREAAEDIEILIVKENIESFLAEIEHKSLDELCQMYVNTFDFNQKVALYLTYSAAGEEQERGQILVELKAAYEKAGFELASSELPDYLPLFLEFVAVTSEKQGQAMMKQYLPVIQNLGTELDKDQSPYRWLFQACLNTAAEFINA